MIIPGFSAYDITEDGVVTHVASGNVMKTHTVTYKVYYRYIRVRLAGDDGNIYACNILRLLALAYLGKPSVPSMARAKDGDNLNTSLSNVEWVPYAKGTLDAWERGKYEDRKPKVNKCCNEDTIELVLNTLEQLKSPVTTAELSRMLDVPYSTARYTIKALVTSGKVKTIIGKGHVLV